MKTDGKFYTGITGENENGNDKYSPNLKACISEAGEFCLSSLKDEKYEPIMMLGNIQSGKTRAFIGLMSLCFDNDFDMTIILTKCSRALVKQTVSRMMDEFDQCRTGNATVGDVIAQDILDLDFKGLETMEEKEARARQFLGKYRKKKRIIVVKKQAENVDRINFFIEELVKQDFYKRILIIDDEADITSIGYEKLPESEEISLRRISGAINTMRQQMQSNTEHVLMQVTATPYALYLQPEIFSDDYIMPIKPSKTVIVPTGAGYIGGQYYFLDSENQNAQDYTKSKHLLEIVDQEEMSILNGSRKNSGKNSVINDKRTVKMQDFIENQSKNSTFIFPSLRKWLFDIIVGSSIIQLNSDYEDFYISAVMHAATTKNMHKEQKKIIEEAINHIQDALSENIENEDIKYFIEASYNNLKNSVETYSVINMPTLQDVREKIASSFGNGIEGIITEIDIKEVNSDNDIEALLNSRTGELRLENSITIFIGGQVLDRGITIPNLISFFYGRDPASMQQDTVMQHCRMFGYRTEILLSVTKFYTTRRLFSSMQEITIRDNILRERMRNHDSSNVVYLEAGDKIRACSPQKVLASKINNILPEKRYLPVGFDVDKKIGKISHKKIQDQLENINGILDDEISNFKKGLSTQGRYIEIDSKNAIELIKTAYEPLLPKDDGNCNKIENIEPTFWFSLSEKMKENVDGIALIVRRNRELSRTKRKGTLYQDAPDDGNNEGALARELRKKMPVLLLIEQVHPDWKQAFWWPVYYTPVDMNVGIYSDAEPKTGIAENLASLGPHPLKISEFNIINRVNLSEDLINSFNRTVNSVLSYYDKEFFIENAVDSEINRKEIPCPIYIDDCATESLEQNINSDLKKIHDKALAVLDTIEQLSGTNKDFITEYFKMLINQEIVDEKRENVLEIVKSSTIEKEKQDKIVELIYEAEEKISSQKELFGHFIPTGAGKCEIRIYYDVIKRVCNENGISGNDAIMTFCEYVIAHEMYHAIHYSDVMTMSGRWLYLNKDYVKQNATQESLAEYFARCYASDVLKDNIDKYNLRKMMFDILNLDDFPKDGGYSGSLIIEKNDRGSIVGENNKLYSDMNIASLRDMPKAYKMIMDQFEKAN